MRIKVQVDSGVSKRSSVCVEEQARGRQATQLLDIHSSGGAFGVISFRSAVILLVFSEISEESSQPRIGTILHIELKFQFNHACLQGVEASANVSNNSVFESTTQTQ